MSKDRWVGQLKTDIATKILPQVEGNLVIEAPTFAVMCETQWYLRRRHYTMQLKTFQKWQITMATNASGVKVNSKTKLDGTIMLFRITQKNSYMG